MTENHEWEAWILYLLQAVEETATFTRERIASIRDLMQETGEVVKALPGRVYSKELVEVIFRQPYSKTQFLVDAGIAERKTAAGYLRQLEAGGILHSQRVGREVLFLNTRLYELLAT